MTRFEPRDPDAVRHSGLALLTLVVVVVLVATAIPTGLSGNSLKGGAADHNLSPSGDARSLLAPDTPSAAGVNKTESAVIGGWSDLTPTLTGSPNKRYGEGFAYDPQTNSSYLFGGYNDSLGLLNDTWRFQGTTWTKVVTSTSPSPRYLDLPMVYDPEERGIVLFGGLTGIFSYSVNDTWLFNGTAWKNLSSKVAPPNTAEGVMTWDPALAGLLCVVPTQPAESWLFKGGNWSQLYAQAEPPPLGQASIAYDAGDGYALLFGGYDSTSQTWVNATYAFNGSTWTMLSEPRAPDGRLDAKLVFDNQTNSLILFGGLTGNYGGQLIYNDTWAFVRGAWISLNQTAAPPGLWLAGATYDTAGQRLLLVDGQDVNGVTHSLTWELTGSLVTLEASVSSSTGDAPLPVWLNATSSGGLPADSIRWMVSNGFNASTSDAFLTLLKAGNFVATVSLDARAGTFFQQTLLQLTFRINVVWRPYPVDFIESGLPFGTNWSATLAGETRSSVTPAIAFTETYGNYSYSIGSVPGYLAAPSSGTVNITTSAQSVSVTFTLPPPPEYSVVFHETGLPSGENWSVNLDGVLQYSVAPTITFAEPNGSYSYAVQNLARYASSPAIGRVAVQGQDQIVPVDFSLRPAPHSSVTIDEIGLPAGTAWSVTINSTAVQSTSTSIVWTALNGTYPWTANPVPGYQVAPATGQVTVRGTNQSFTLTFTPSTSGSTPLGSGGENLLLLVGLAALIAVAVTTILVVLRRRARRRKSPPTDAESSVEEPTDPE